VQRKQMRHQAEKLTNQSKLWQLKRDQERLKIQLEQLPRELRGRWLDI